MVLGNDQVHINRAHPEAYHNQTIAIEMIIRKPVIN